MAKNKKKNGADAKRAAKKHAKEVKRKRALAERARGEATEPGRPDHAWRPAREGIEGLARRMGITTHSASQLADHLHQHHGRKDAAAAWLPSRVQALGVEGVIDGLAARGVIPEQARFRSLAAELLSARQLAESEWVPRLPSSHDVHDRDFCRQAAEQLWLEWCPEVYSDERLDEELHAIDIAMDEEDPRVCASRLLQVWLDLGAEAADRLTRTGTLMRFFDLAGAVYDLTAEDGAVDPETRSALADALRRMHSVPTLDPEQRYHVGALADDFEWSLGRGEEVLSRMLLAAMETDDPVPVMDAAAMILDQDDATMEQLLRVRDLLVERLPSLTGHHAEDVEAYIADLEERASEAAMTAEPRPRPRPVRKGGNR